MSFNVWFFNEFQLDFQWNFLFKCWTCWCSKLISIFLIGYLNFDFYWFKLSVMKIFNLYILIRLSNYWILHSIMWSTGSCLLWIWTLKPLPICELLGSISIGLSVTGKIEYQKVCLWSFTWFMSLNFSFGMFRKVWVGLCNC
jgi:hypothetical protein